VEGFIILYIMAKELPYFKFFPAEWLLGRISDETDNIQGIFARVMSIYWHENCSITLDNLQRKVHKSKVQCLINNNYITVEDGMVIIEFLDEQYSELSDLSDRRSKAGRKGGQAKVKQTLSNAKANPKHLEKNKIRKEIEKKENGDFTEMKNTFLSFYKNKKNVDYYFTGKDAGALKQLINKLKATLKSVGKEANLTDTFAGFLNAINDEWILENLSISLINSKYNEILAKIRKGGSSKGYTGNDKFERVRQIFAERDRANN